MQAVTCLSHRNVGCPTCVSKKKGRKEGRNQKFSSSHVRVDILDLLSTATDNHNLEYIDIKTHLNIDVRRRTLVSDNCRLYILSHAAA